MKLDKDRNNFILFMWLSLLTFLFLLFPISVSKASFQAPTYTVVNLDMATQTVKQRYGNINDINIILRDLTKVLKTNYSFNTKFKTVRIDDVVFTENSYLLLIMSSVAYTESTFKKNAKGKLNEIGTYQLRPSTIKYLIETHNFPFKIKSMRELNNEKATIIATYYVNKHLSTENGNIIRALSRYNGDKSLKYGKKINKLVHKTIKFI